MATIVTRTTNPLPFGDLEPHRFEDLVRQLAYDLRRWKSLEATGRSGSDDGIDIRAVEQVFSDPEPGEEDTASEEPEAIAERLWIFQCKREKNLSPQRVRQLVKESLASLAKPPYGFILAAACDLSKKARDVFREEMVAAGIQEFHIWAKGELEDMLFQPKNDSLLFAYFGLSLQPRRRSLATSLRSIITKKKQLNTLLPEENNHGKLILLRDPTDTRYPYEDPKNEKAKRWLLCYALTLKKPDHLIVLRNEFLAAYSPDNKQWDAMLDVNFVEDRAHSELKGKHTWRNKDDATKFDLAQEFWREYVPSEEQAKLVIRRAIPLNRLLAIDPIGDGYYPVPHLLIEFDKKYGPFTNEYFDRLESTNQWNQIDIEPLETNRTKIFPIPLPNRKAMPPTIFDQTGKASKLTTDGAAKLEELLEKLKLGASKANRIPSPPDVADDAGLREFAAWRERVGRPVLSGIVLRLRQAGHQARIVTRSKPGLDYVELRFGLAGLYPHNPEYLLSGHVRFAYSSRLYLEIEPKEYDPRGGYNPPPTLPPLSNLDQTVIEGQVLTLLARLRKNA